ncbi:MAG: CarD family transcriptional regulator [Ruminococcus sp.]|nr:CarD family transcriptional regulator [Ruminococcus sp.]
MSTAELTHKIGEFVVYKKHGIYEIAEIRREKICSELKTYYILKSVYDSNATVYVPTDKEDLVNQMEKVLSKKEIEDIILCSKSEPMEWIPANAERFQTQEDIIAQGNLSVILAMMRLLMNKKEEAIRTKTKVFAHDDRMLTACQKIICEAFAFSLGLDKKGVLSYLDEAL